MTNDELNATLAHARKAIAKKGGAIAMSVDEIRDLSRLALAAVQTLEAGADLCVALAGRCETDELPNAFFAFSAALAEFGLLEGEDDEEGQA